MSVIWKLFSKLRQQPICLPTPSGNGSLNRYELAVFKSNRFIKLTLISLFLCLIPSLVLAGGIHLRKPGIGPEGDSLFSAALADAAQVLGGATASTLEVEWVREIPQRGVQLAWSQSIGGIPVREAIGRMWLVADESGKWSCRYRAFKCIPWQAPPTPSEFVDPQTLMPGTDFPERNWSEPVLEYVMGESKEAVLVWVFHGAAIDESLHSTLRIDYSALTGEQLLVEEVVCSIDVSGSIFANRTVGTGPQGSSSNSVQPISGVRVSGGGASTQADGSGSYTLSSSLNNFTVLAELEGVWGSVNSSAAPSITVSAPSNPNALDLVFDGNGDSNFTAQLNAFHYVDQGYRLFVESAGGFPAMSTPVNATTGMTGSCNAYYDPFQQLLRFLRPGGGCVDSAYSSVVLHEFGHHVVNSLNLSQGAFGEGYGDSLAIVFLQDGVIGRDFSGAGSHVRNVGTSNVVVPCSSSIHFCGQALGKFWFNLSDALRSELGAVTGQQVLEQIFVDWSALTLGGISGFPIRDEMVLEVLMADDDDSNLDNGSPHWNQICSAAIEGGLACPDLSTLLLTLVQGPAELIPPQVPQTVSVSWETVSSSPAVAQAEIRYRVIGSPSWQSAPLQEAPNFILEGEIPPQICLDQIEWYVSVPDLNGFVTVYPPLGSSQPLSTMVATSQQIVLEESMASDPGWSTSLPTDSALVGQWEYGIPVGTAAQASAGVPSSSGDSAGYFTGLGLPGGSLGADDIDFGDTTLTSTDFILDASSRHEVSYWRWFCNNASASTPDDILTVSLSLDGGGSWNVIEQIGPGHPHAGGGWFQNSFSIDQGASSNNTFRLRFHTGDLGAGSICEAGVDLVEVKVIDCEVTGPPPPPPVENDFIPSDCNGDGSNDLSDAVQLLEVLFGASVDFSCEDACDSNDDGSVNVGDAIQLLQALFGGGGLPLNGVCGPDATADSLDCQVAPPCP
ncbi:MAG: hypothetical protein CBC13_07930 [Planctomycetia bacterium TMED53]|nr:MAG: hypothetical protein CBC13_07930 [Planctomycetia bacterium TMED53]